ncbi:MAG: WYL domain-containing protein [Ruminococcaceae bacterium]|nr:WYL domain-containing protein [Oscillospiraceae bacterium]
MPKSSNQKLKLIYLMKILLEKTDEEHGMTTADIIAALAAQGISAERKSIYDDIEALRLFGIDIVKNQNGRGTDYRVVSRDFEMPELKLLVDAVQSSKFITRKKSDELIKKIEGFASIHEARQLHRQVYVANRIKTMNESIYLTVDKIHSAITLNKKITFQYFEWSPKKEKILRHDGALYSVSPWALTWDDENYYLIAYESSSNLIKHYRVDKMLKISVTDDEREGKELFDGFDMALYSKKTFGMFGGKEETVRLRCKNKMANIIIDRFGTESIISCVDSEHFEITVKVAVSPVFLSWLMNFGSDIKIISPQSVIEKFKNLAKESLEQY